MLFLKHQKITKIFRSEKFKCIKNHTCCNIKDTNFKEGNLEKCLKLATFHIKNDILQENGFLFGENSSKIVGYTLKLVSIEGQITEYYDILKV